VIVTAVTTLAVIVAFAVAPVPSPTIVTEGAVAYPEPPEVTLMTSIPPFHQKENYVYHKNLM
jgi:hypothetical protein